MNTVEVEFELTWQDISPLSARLALTAFATAEPRASLPIDSVDAILQGPFCQAAKTLPTRLRLSRGDAGRVGCLLPDPSFWSPRLPAAYRVTGRVECLGRQREINQQTGIRHLATRNDSFTLQGERWVVRGAHRAPLSDDLLDWRSAECSLLAESPSDELCLRASELGVLMIAALPGRPGGQIDELRRLHQHAAVALVLFDETKIEAADTDAADTDAARRFPNLLMGHCQRRQQDNSAWPAWSRWTLAPVTAGDSLDVELQTLTDLAGSHSRPVIVSRLTECQTIDIRRHCDRLQRDLAPTIQVAGYLC